MLVWFLASFSCFFIISLTEINFIVPSAVLTAEEQRDIMLMIVGRSPIGTPISTNILPRNRALTAL